MITTRQCEICGAEADIIVRVDFSDGPHRYPVCEECGDELGAYVEDWEPIEGWNP